MRRPIKAGERAYKLEFVDLPSAALTVARTDDEQDALLCVDVAGTYVKLQPTLRASERAAFDDKKIRGLLEKAGAAAVVMAPIVVPDAVDAAALPDSTQHSPREHIESYLSQVKANKAVIAAAIEEAMSSLADSGL